MDKIDVIERGSFPETLENMKGRPQKLYYRGIFPAPKEQKYLCVVGSRKWTSYGRDAVRKIIVGLRGYPISIVSGLAIGIDSISHIAALEAGLHCIAFPGSTLAWDDIYPSSHIDLAKRIVENGGALVSQWEVGYPTDKWAFPSRNLVMAGLSHATLIVEAAYRSGSLMTAEHAEKCGRDVFAIPGPINAANSYGPHMLIKNGAALIRSAEDVLRELGFIVQEAGTANSHAWLDANKRKAFDALSRSILDAISREEMNIDALLEKTRAKPIELNGKVSALELEGLIRIEDGVVKIV